MDMIIVLVVIHLVAICIYVPKYVRGVTYPHK
jgi:hypothetical protein